MGKKNVDYFCASCGAQFLKWAGKCTNCGEWDTISEFRPSKIKGNSWVASGSGPRALIDIRQDASSNRWITEVFEFDRVVGGGIVKGSIGLLGGTPGVGKSTLVLQLLSRITKLNKKVIYISGEESATQIKNRADRLLINQEDILILIESTLENSMAVLEKEVPDFVVIDSIQTLYSNEISGTAGSVTQVRETATLLMKYAKQTDTSVVLIGHVTKGGDIAGPRTLEHMVDYVLYLEGEKREQSRILRAVKNRFGTISEIGIFKMTGKGLAEVKSSNSLFLDKFQITHPGTSIFPANEGSRTMFLEIQVLVGDTQQSNPARTVMGMDRNRLQVLVAVLEKHLEMDFSQNDIYVNIASGLKVIEPAVDMAILAALISSHLNKLLPNHSVFLGEIALTGEFRQVSSAQERIYESVRGNFKKIFVPLNMVDKLKVDNASVQLIGLIGVQQLLDAIV